MWGEEEHDPKQDGGHVRLRPVSKVDVSLCDAFLNIMDSSPVYKTILTKI